MTLVDVTKAGPLLESNRLLPGLMSFGVLRREHGFIWPFTSDETSVPTRLLRDLIRLALECVRVDERYYLRSYPDVVEALEAGRFATPRHHYTEFGYFEDRLPFRIEVDEEFYFRWNPDTKASVNAGLIPSAQVHFERHGYK